ncbi:MAG TPA: ATPase, partial [Anaeromyxobacter sp.]|nr:ATPase [Anaeromyxobacter sp.]
MILPMARVELVGPRDLLPAALRFLQAQGVLELHAPPADRGVAPCTAPAELAARAASAEEALRRIDALRPRLPAAHAGEQAGPLPEPGTPALLEVLGAAESQVDALEARRAALVEESAAVARFTRLVEALAPLRHTLDPSLAPEMHAVELRNDPEAVALLANEVRSITGGACEVSAKPLDAERTGVLVVVPRVHGRAVTALLFERGVDEVRLPAHYAGKGVLDLLLLVAARARAVPGERAAADEAFARVAGRLTAPLEQAAADAHAELERLRAVARCGATRFAFVAT